MQFVCAHDLVNLAVCVFLLKVIYVRAITHSVLLLEKLPTDILKKERIVELEQIQRSKVGI